MKNSMTLDSMLKNKKGYRTENYSGRRERRVYDVIRGEISMGNTDIVDYMRDKYSILSDYTCEEDDMDYFSHICQENAPHIAEEIEKFLVQSFKVKSIDDLFAIWLTEYDEVVRHYNSGSTEKIDTYDISEEHIVLSDLSLDGSLFVMKK